MPHDLIISVQSLIIVLLISACIASNIHCQSNDIHEVAVLWQDVRPKGEIKVRYGQLEKLEILQGQGIVSDNRFEFSSSAETRMILTFNEYNINPGSASTLVSIYTEKYPFSFFLRDVNTGFPIYIPEYHVIVTAADDSRDFEVIRKSITNQKLINKLESIESESETSYEAAALITRDQTCPTWLGISRDVRIFEVHYAMKNDPNEYEIITPRLVSQPIRLEELDNQHAEYAFATGRGQGPVLNSNRRLEDGVIPILHTTLVDEDITYHSVCFASLELSPLKAAYIQGTHYLVADHYCYGHMFTETQQKLLEEKQKEDSLKNEETVLYFRSIAENNSDVPRYAWFKAIKPGRGWWSGFNWSFEPETGFSLYENGKIFCISKLNGKPLPNEEIAILLQPGETALFEFFLPHSPIPRERAEKLAGESFKERYHECRLFWKQKLEAASGINLPEKRIEEMMYAGLLHLDLVAYGHEPDGTLAPTIGVYSPIGTESAPIIQYFNSMGWHDVAKRSLMYFLDKQHDDGMIQNFGGYMVETGAALWSMGEYFRYTRDLEWVEEIKSKLLKSC